jgi:DNA-binding NarL/FixJ family response regulator
MTALVRVLIADDSDVFLAACRNVVGATPGFETVGTASSGEEAIERATELRPDLVLMDAIMPGIGGIEAARRLHELLPDVTLVVMTADSRLSAQAPDAVFALISKVSLAPATLTELWNRRVGS